MKKKLLLAAVAAQSVLVLGTLVYLFASVLSGPPTPPHKPPHAAVVPDDEGEALEPEPPASKKHTAVAHATKEPDELGELPSNEKPVAKPDAPATKGELAEKKPEEPVKPARAKRPDPADRPSTVPPTLAESLSTLMDGNERFAHGVTRARDLIETRRAPARPSAVVLTCSDASVPPELLFDQSLGSLIVVRTAAHLVDDGALAAVEDSVARLHVPLVVVVGHQQCHAVDASVHSGQLGPGESTVAARLRPMLTPLRKVFTGAELSSHAVELNVTYTAAQLAKRSKLLRARQVPIMRVVYDEDSGVASWLDSETEEPHAPERSGRSTH